MSLADKLKERKGYLKPVTTVITRTDGVKVLEERTISGEKKHVEIGKSYGFCCDNSPDGELHCVMKNLYISSQDGAHNYEELKKRNITHILNVATGVANVFSEEFVYKTVEILDLPEEDITTYFPQLFLFIDQGINNGAIVVHCNAGISRSSTVIIAYLMNSQNISLQDAFQMVKNARHTVKPNSGFWKRLLHYEQQLSIK